VHNVKPTVYIFLIQYFQNFQVNRRHFFIDEDVTHYCTHHSDFNENQFKVQI